MVVSSRVLLRDQGWRQVPIDNFLAQQRFVSINEPAHSWLQLSLQSEVAVDFDGELPAMKSGRRKERIRRCSVIMAFPVHDVLTRFSNLRNPLNITPSVE